MEFLKEVYGSPSVSAAQVLRMEFGDSKSLRVTYNSRESFKKYAKSFGLMDDFKVFQTIFVLSILTFILYL